MSNITAHRCALAEGLSVLPVSMLLRLWCKGKEIAILIPINAALLVLLPGRHKWEGANLKFTKKIVLIAFQQFDQQRAFVKVKLSQLLCCPTSLLQVSTAAQVSTGFASTKTSQPP